jgi:hypothetical protein
MDFNNLGWTVKMLDLISKDDKARRFAYTVVFSGVGCWVLYLLLWRLPEIISVIWWW